MAVGGSAEGLEGVEGGEDGAGILEDEGSGGYGEVGVEGFVGVGDFNFAPWCGGGSGGFEREGYLLAGGEVVFATEVEAGVDGTAHVAAEAGDAGAGGRYGDGEDETGAAIFEG